MAAFGVEFVGLDKLSRDLKRADNEVLKQLRKDMRTIGKHVAQTAKGEAEGAGLVLTGRLVKGIKPSVRGTTGYIRATAVQRGFNYPVRYEFGDRKRPFLQPALGRDEGYIVREMEQSLDRALRSVNL